MNIVPWAKCLFNIDEIPVFVGIYGESTSN